MPYLCCWSGTRASNLSAALTGGDGGRADGRARADDLLSRFNSTAANKQLTWQK